MRVPSARIDSELHKQTTRGSRGYFLNPRPTVADKICKLSENLF